MQHESVIKLTDLHEYAFMLHYVHSNMTTTYILDCQGSSDICKHLYVFIYTIKFTYNATGYTLH